MPLKSLDESALTTAAIAGIAAVAAKLAYDKYKKHKNKKKVEEEYYGNKNNSEDKKELLSADERIDAYLIGREASQELANSLEKR